MLKTASKGDKVTFVNGLTSGLLLAGLVFSNSLSAQELRACGRTAGSLPDNQRPAGFPDVRNPIEHIVVIMQENHSFDSYFGKLNQKAYYGSQIDGALRTMTNPDANGNPVPRYHYTSLCPQDPDHTWDAMHKSWNDGHNDGFVKVNGANAMGYFDQTDLQFYYDLANKFAVADRYFASTMTQTFPNRFFLLAATAFGHIRNDLPRSKNEFPQKTIFDVLNQYNVSWKYYKDGIGYLALFQPLYWGNITKMVPIKEFAKDLSLNTLPQVVFIDSDADGEDEHPDGNVQEGQLFVEARIQELMASTSWNNSVLFLTYDENGGFYDHVSPPSACVPDDVEPVLGGNEGTEPGRYDRYGFRVPFVAVSPYAKHHYVSHRTYDHTSILKYIETKFNLPALTQRDANADGLRELFDYDHPVFKTELNKVVVDNSKNCNLINLDRDSD